MNIDFDEAVTRIAEKHHGVFSVDHLDLIGVPRSSDTTGS
jgi:hypothetical protein